MDAAPVTRLSAFERSTAGRNGVLRKLYRCPVTARVFPRLDLAPSSDHAFRFDLAMRSLPGLSLAEVTCSSARAGHGKEDCRHDDLFLNLTLSGRRTVSRRGREVEFGDGEALLSTGAEAFEADFSQTRFISLRVPMQPIAALVKDVRDRLFRPIPRDTEALSLLASYAGLLLQDEQIPIDGPMQRLAVAHVHDLVTLALGATRDVAEIANARGARAARLRVVKHDVLQNLARADLSVATVAARQRLPVRYVQRLFEADGTTFTAFLLGERLARAHRLLRDPLLRDRPIGALAYEAGFTNQAYFNRVFRARFCVSPSDIRDQARAQDQWSG